MQYVNNVIDHPKREIIEKRVDIIKFFDEFGPEATRKAFGKSRSTIYLWKQKLNSSDGKLSALAPGDKAPIQRRQRTPHPFIEDFILSYRTDHPGADKTTITPALIKACNLANVKPVSESTVGRIIHDLKQKGRLPKSNRISINGKSGNLLTREPRRPVKKARRKGFIPQKPGDIVQMDTVSIFADGLKRYIFTAIDVKTRFAFACTYKSNSSANGCDFLNKFITVAPFSTARIQTDNGGEFHKHFDKLCSQYDLIHFFNYPKHPQSNAHLERFNKTVQDQFVSRFIDYLDDLDSFNAELMQYLIWYNTEKPHRSIGKIPPLQFFIDNFYPRKKSNMLWTLTTT